MAGAEPVSSAAAASDAFRRAAGAADTLRGALLALREVQ